MCLISLWPVYLYDIDPMCTFSHLVITTILACHVSVSQMNKKSQQCYITCPLTSVIRHGHKI